MFHGNQRLAILAGVLAFGATGMALALTGAGVPFLAAALIASGAAGLVQWTALRSQPPPPPPDLSPVATMQARIERYRAATGSLRHDLRGVLSPALMMSDRLLNHADPAVQRAGQAVVRSIERATALLAEHRDALSAPEERP